MRPLQERQRLCDSIGVKNFVFFHDKLRIGASMDRQTTTLLNGLPERVSEVVWQIVLPQDFVQLIDCAVVVDAGFEATLSLEQCLPRSSGISPPGTLADVRLHEVARRPAILLAVSSYWRHDQRNCSCVYSVYLLV